ncbi:MAG: Trm112 family protein [Candidatus Krumholzibacteriia bacterium]
MLDPKLLEILACPACRQPVTPDEAHAWLYCRKCAVRYRVEDGIPIMLVEEAEKWDPARGQGGSGTRAGEQG